jgi:hypothetical protein
METSKKTSMAGRGGATLKAVPLNGTTTDAAKGCRKGDNSSLSDGAESHGNCREFVWIAAAGLGSPREAFRPVFVGRRDETCGGRRGRARS